MRAGFFRCRVDGAVELGRFGSGQDSTVSRLPRCPRTNRLHRIHALRRLARHRISPARVPSPHRLTPLASLTTESVGLNVDGPTPALHVTPEQRTPPTSCASVKSSARTASVAEPRLVIRHHAPGRQTAGDDDLARGLGDARVARARFKRAAVAACAARRSRCRGARTSASLRYADIRSQRRERGR